ncbi:hypothetical protein B0H14DRAFT_2619167 [Mycena olivaceomarginata]|nr:hypothetical protein B0H14DRAFT_2619167 [Mycena olivaceomarginata]
MPGRWAPSSRSTCPMIHIREVGEGPVVHLPDDAHQGGGRGYPHQEDRAHHDSHQGGDDMPDAGFHRLVINTRLGITKRKSLSELGITDWCPPNVHHSADIKEHLHQHPELRITDWVNIGTMSSECTSLGGHRAWVLSVLGGRPSGSTRSASHVLFVDLLGDACHAKAWKYSNQSSLSFFAAFMNLPVVVPSAPKSYRQSMPFIVLLDLFLFLNHKNLSKLRDWVPASLGWANHLICLDLCQATPSEGEGGRKSFHVYEDCDSKVMMPKYEILHSGQYWQDIRRRAKETKAAHAEREARAPSIAPTLGDSGHVFTFVPGRRQPYTGLVQTSGKIVAVPNPKSTSQEQARVAQLAAKHKERRQAAEADRVARANRLQQELISFSKPRTQIQPFWPVELGEATARFRGFSNGIEKEEIILHRTVYHSP